MNTQMQLAEKYAVLAPLLNERQRRLWAGTEARAVGRGGISRVAQATGLSRMTVRAGLREAAAPEAHPTQALAPERVRHAGAGRPPLTEADPTLVRDLEALVEPHTRGDPQAPLRWTCKSTTKLATALQAQGHTVSPRKVAQLLLGLGYRLQGTRKIREGSHHPDRNAQFAHINTRTKAFQKRGQPVVSVDTKKKELVGDFQQKGREWQPSGQPEPVRVHDFRDPDLGIAIPYGVYDVTHNQGWVSVGLDHDTAEFAVESVRQWWWRMGRRLYPAADELLVVADGGGSNGSRNRLWKRTLQRLADETGLRISVCHFPPGTSKWNKIEHRLFCHLTQNWRGRPLVSHAVVVNLIAHTTTAEGLQVQAAMDTQEYPTGIKVSQEEFAALNIHHAKFHGEWNYTIKPSTL
jgi:Rhodopirellula transposase DDE domain